MSTSTVAAFVVLATAIVGFALALFRRRLRRKKALAAPKTPTGLRWTRVEDLRPDVAAAYDRGVMTNEQMTELLKACGHDVKLDKGKIVSND